jgi:hypothetical protein
MEVASLPGEELTAACAGAGRGWQRGNVCNAVAERRFRLCVQVRSTQQRRWLALCHTLSVLLLHVCARVRLHVYGARGPVMTPLVTPSSRGGSGVPIRRRTHSCLRGGRAWEAAWQRGNVCNTVTERRFRLCMQVRDFLYYAICSKGDRQLCVSALLSHVCAWCVVCTCEARGSVRTKEDIRYRSCLVRVTPWVTA